MHYACSTVSNESEGLTEPLHVGAGPCLLLSASAVQLASMEGGHIGVFMV